jgi:transcriptional regulator with XRE-family HTH domain
MPKKPKTELAARLKQTAHDAEFTAEQIAEQLGVSSAAVWAWWSGRNEPPVEMLVAYARVVGRCLEYLATGVSASGRDPALFAEWLFALVDRVMAGEEPSHAFDAVTKSPAILNDRERRSFQRRAGAFRRFIGEAAGRPWEELSEDERRSLVDRLLKAEE